jgi:membrane associated rhomboid family serine protease
VVFPIADDNSGRRTLPAVTIALIAINVLVFLLPQGFGTNLDFTYAFSTVPAEIVSGRDIVTENRIVRAVVQGQQVAIEVPGLKPTPIPVWLTLLTSMFMHGGIMHLLGNMWFLWIFGDNVEDDLGRGRFVLFYLLTGLVASLAHVLLNASGPSSLTPTLGASGAISGVLGGYLLLHPHRQVTVILLRILTVVPAYVAVGIWFLFQIVNGLGMLGGIQGGVAYGAHIGGFVAGLALVKLFAPWQRPARHETYESPERDEPLVWR